MATRILLVLMLVTLVDLRMTGAQSFNYCRFTRSHTLCQEGIGPNCGGQVRDRGVSDLDAKLILALMNQLRSRVALGRETKGVPGPQPSAANMMLLEWDPELARLAQGHADKCVFEHECHQCRRVPRFGTGQVLFISYTTNLELQRQWPFAIRAWYDEVSLFSRHHVNPFHHKVATGHYTQMLWATSYKVGCGYSLFREGQWWKKLYTCNYGPGGNKIPGVVYRGGRPCSACSRGMSCSRQYPGLCGSRSAIAKAPSLGSLHRQLYSSGLPPFNQVKSTVSESEKPQEETEEVSPAAIMEKFLGEAFLNFTIPFKGNTPKLIDLLPALKQVGAEILTATSRLSFSDIFNVLKTLPKKHKKIIFVKSGLSQTIEKNVEVLGQTIEKNVEVLGQTIEKNVEVLGQTIEKNVEVLGQTIEKNVEVLGQTIEKNVEVLGQTIEKNVEAVEGQSIEEKVEAVEGQSIEEKVEAVVGLTIEKKVEKVLGLTIEKKVEAVEGQPIEKKVEAVEGQPIEKKVEAVGNQTIEKEVEVYEDAP